MNRQNRRIKPRLVCKKRVHGGVKKARQYLTGLDILAGHFSASLFYVYPNGLDVARLEQSLAIVLRQYPMLAGQLKKNSSGLPYVDANDAGVDFRIYKVPGRLPEYGPGNPIQKHARRYFKPVYPWTAFRADTPVFSVRLFQFDDYGMVASFTVIHSLVDGSTMWNFLLDWSRVARGGSDVADTVDRDFLLGLSERYVDRPYTKGNIGAVSLWKRLAVYGRFIYGAFRANLGLYRVPAAFIAGLREQLTREYPDHPRTSDADLITAHCLKTVASLRGCRRDIRVGMVSDLRFKSALKVPKRLCGVALAQEEFHYSASELSRESIATLALKGRTAGMAQTGEELEGYLGYMERHRRERRIAALVPRFITSRRNDGFMQNNYCSFPVYDIDFGSGRPTFCSPLAVPYRMVKIVPTPEDDGGVDVHLMLSRKELKAISEQYGPL